ncbi:wall-associated receptor kinase 2-like [Magnolia sinica]|uniref:wall-associated receptor kinase 2-like n=1 Tax=Magnolia sinica TaxID=86752 RepID=UPI0026592AEE|nr:wall-associated receptor kinase 2-like [Magnolia sinica]
MTLFSKFLSFLLFLITAHFSFSHADTNSTLLSCSTKCGSVEITYPFGIGHGCYLPGFEVICNQSIPFLSQSNNIQLLEILEGHVRINSSIYIAKFCTYINMGDAEYVSIELGEESPFTVSVTSNTFFAIGCNVAGIMTDNKTTLTECVSQCFPEEPIDNGSCTGKGCCQTSIPSVKERLMIYVGVAFPQGYSKGSGISSRRCIYGFIVEDGTFSFKESDLNEFNATADMAMKLDWAIGEMGCDEVAKKKKDVYACGERSICVDSNRGSGYLCQCPDGFSGNPYLNGSQGCQDINECLNSSRCVPGAVCVNKVPGYKCKCPKGSSGDGFIDGSGCTKSFPVIRVVLGVGLSILIFLVGGSWLYWALKKRRLINLREKFFRENGGLLLQSQISSRDGSRKESTRIFTSEELDKATNNYDDSRILGKGGHGTVYKGILEDGRVVAIKKSKLVDKRQIQQFINEVVILTQINHRNVVKLLGCCLETQVPLLVYEYVSNGTLHCHIHANDIYARRISWEDRLRIATEIAEALAYLHSSASIPIFHRDVKSSNILLDEKYTAKVCDFGISRLVELDQNEITTLVQGTLGYLDPEYFQTSQLTAKSDVYSFGVVLVELLTGQKPVSFERSEEGTNLAMYFLSSMRTRKLADILEVEILREERMDEVKAVAELAMKCLQLKGERRPMMKEVVQELSSLKDFHPHTQEDTMWSIDYNESNGDWDTDSEVFPSEMGR